VKPLKISFFLLLIIGVLSGCVHTPKHPPLSAIITDHLIDADGKKVDRTALFTKPYVLLYFSAHTCPPCRRFTPKFVKFYNAYGKDRPFNVVFVSSDKTKEKMFNYMQQMHMPWFAVPHKSPLAERLTKEFCKSGIPNLVLLDQQGNIIADCYKNRRYYGPQKVLDLLVKKTGKAPPKVNIKKPNPNLSSCSLNSDKPCG